MNRLRLKIIFLAVLLLAMLWLVAGCKSYSASHIVLHPDGSTNSITREYYGTLLIVGEASQLKASTQTDTYIKTIGIDKITTKGDADAIRAGGAAIGELGGSAVGIP